MLTALLQISPREVSFHQRGFQAAHPAAREQLEAIGRTFLHGYHLSLSAALHGYPFSPYSATPDALSSALDQVNADHRGFAYEGAAMALTLLDLLIPWRRDRLQRFLAGPGAAHVYMVHVGAGWALARLRRRPARFLAHLDPLLRWLALDGYGFHEGYFHWPRTVKKRETPRRLNGYALRVFDQGLGRSLWFICGADVERIAATLSRFAPTRHADLWSGVGLACAYAGGVEDEPIEALTVAAGRYRPQLCQGVAFAAKARQRAGNPAVHTELTSQIVCGLSADEAAAITDTTLGDLPKDDPEPAYQVWRSRIQSHFATEVVQI